MRVSVAIAMLLVAGAAAGCTGGEAYVDRPYEINRDSRYFPYGPKLRPGDSVTVCYAKSAATPAVINKLADDECARFGLSAHLKEQVQLGCSLRTPIAAVFSCEADAASGRTPVNPAGTPVAGTGPQPALGPAEVKGSVLPDNFGSASVSTTAKSEPFPTFLFSDPNRPAQ